MKMPLGKLLPRYVIDAALPYVLLSLLLLTAILFAQQASRLAELTLYAQVPFTVMANVAMALVPGVLLLALPTAVLAGVMVGLARMGSDSELVAMRAAGVGPWRMLWPMLLVGLIVSAATAYLNIKEAPRAAREIRKAALQAALRKLDSPVEPRTFTAEIPAFVIYVRDGDKARGSWGRVFIYTQQDNSVRLVTARSGRIDSSGDKSELVLSDAAMAKLPSSLGSDQPYVMERSDQLRVVIDIGRQSLVDRLEKEKLGPEELEWSDLRTQATSGTDAERREAQRTLNRRLALSVSPLLFALVGGALGLRVRRGGRGMGVLLALAILIVYYLISLLGESLARIGTVSAFVGGWMGTVTMLLLAAGFLLFNRVSLAGWLVASLAGRTQKQQKAAEQMRSASTARTRHFGFPSLLDLDLFRTLTLSFAAGFAALLSIFIIFTLFEMWRFIGANRSGLALVSKYLLFLLPLVAVEIFPATMLITVLISYALIARRSEAIAWWACGQSVYRLMLPGLVFAVLASAVSWLIQERVMPQANVKQDAFRAQIRGGGARITTGSGRQWLASPESNRLYSYEFDEQRGTLSEPAVYELDSEGVHLARITNGSTARWTASNVLKIQNAHTFTLEGMEIQHQVLDEKELTGVEPLQVFRPTTDRPSQLSARGLSDYLRAAQRRGMQVSALAVALQRKYAAPFGVLVMAFIGMPLALAFGRRGAMMALALAVGVSIAYWGIGGGFQQLGNHGLLPPLAAAWAPPIIFAAAGIYFLSRIRT
ncbi:MAG TPA: LptF/LptG family permease [Pyrinomonadaceae bacterium]|nr:LptF/LptG family permease [Pyrinomonadaceae bacterium]